MNRLLFSFLLLLVAGDAFCQPWKDTNMTVVKLPAVFAGKKVAKLEMGAKATIFFQESDLRAKAKKDLADSSAVIKERGKKLLHMLDRNKKDTLLLNDEDPDIMYIISDMLQKGQAMVYYKKQKKFIPQLTHRLERYGMYADRVFYLPDRRPFYMVLEYSGILDDPKNPRLSDPAELGKEFDKLSNLRKE